MVYGLRVSLSLQKNPALCTDSNCLQIEGLSFLVYAWIEWRYDSTLFTPLHEALLHLCFVCADYFPNWRWGLGQINIHEISLFVLSQVNFIAVVRFFGHVLFFHVHSPRCVVCKLLLVTWFFYFLTCNQCSYNSLLALDMWIEL